MRMGASGANRDAQLGRALLSLEWPNSTSVYDPFGFIFTPGLYLLDKLGKDRSYVSHFTLFILLWLIFETLKRN